MTRLLTESQRHCYEQDGIVFPIPVLSQGEAEWYCSLCDQLEERLGGRPRTIEVRQMHLHFHWAFELATRPRVLDAVEDVLGPNLLIWGTELFAKHPQDAAVSISWHRDSPYMGFDAHMTSTAWIALRDSTVANGCMRAVPRSAERGSHSPVSSLGNPSPRPTGRLAAAPVNECQIVNVLLGAGEMSLHNAVVLHASNLNSSEQKRVGFAIRFVTPEARPHDGRPPAILVRGRDDHNHFRLIDPPGASPSEQALAEMKESAAHHLEGMLKNLKRAGQGDSC
jgi:hypothetical protein